MQNTKKKNKKYMRNEHKKKPVSLPVLNAIRIVLMS
jgi:hypothetical protein